MRILASGAILLTAALIAASTPLAAQAGNTETVFADDGREWIRVDTDHYNEIVSDNVLPLLVFGEEGELILTEVIVEGEQLQQQFFKMDAGDCNGGSCFIGGGSLNCPTSGGPTCGPGERCICKCEEDEGSNSSHSGNQCVPNEPE